MKRFIDCHPVCDGCSGQLAVIGFQIDLPNCCYIIQCECIVCGEEQFLVFGLEDFIEINNLLYPPKGERHYEEPNCN